MVILVHAYVDSRSLKAHFVHSSGTPARWGEQGRKSRNLTYGDGSKPWYLVNPKIAGKWMFIPLKMVLIGIDPTHMAMQKRNTVV